MKAFIIYTDPLLLGINLIVDALKKRYNLKVISFDDLYRNIMATPNARGFSIQKKLEDGLDVSIEICDIISDEIQTSSDYNILIKNYPKTEKQWQSLSLLLTECRFELEHIFYFQAINVIENLEKTEKYKQMVEQVSQDFAHVQETVNGARSTNLKALEIINKPKITSIVEVEAYGMPGERSVESIAKQILRQQE
jgi:adenylate kinase family enzyme